MGVRRMILGYGQGSEKVLEEVKKVLERGKLECVFDGISEKGRHGNYWRAIDPKTERGLCAWWTQR